MKWMETSSDQYFFLMKGIPPHLNDISIYEGTPGVLNRPAPEPPLCSVTTLSLYYYGTSLRRFVSPLSFAVHGEHIITP